MLLLPRITGLELYDPLGGGPFTRVYAGRDLTNDRRVAVKIARDVEFADVLLQREAIVGKSVRHANLVRLRRARLSEPPGHIVYDWIEGESLRSRLQQYGRLDLRTTLWIGRQLAEALTALHRVGFVHGDIKPDNVLVARCGSVSLIDLGFAHRPGDNASFRERGIVLGTANYLAPELCALDNDGDQSADLFSFGVMLFELLTGELPYLPGDVLATLAEHRTTAARTLPDRWPSKVRQLVASLLTRCPQRRPCASVLMLELMRLEIRALSA
jgi:serine/threonine protein kinase